MDPAVALRVTHANVHAKSFGDEAVVLDMSTGTYFSLRGSAIDIWALAEANATPASIVAALGGPEESIARCLSELVGAGLLCSDESLDEVVPESRAGAFMEPEVERFTDMQDLLLLDPIHEVDPTGWPHQLDGA